MNSRLSVTEINRKINDSHLQFVRLYHSVPVTKVIEPSLPSGESVKDILAKIAAWEARGAQALREMAAQTTAPTLAVERDAYVSSRAFYEEREAWDWEEVELDFRAAHDGLLEAVQGLSPELLGHEPVQQTIGQHSWQLYEHYLSDLKRWHQQLSRKRF